MGSTAGGRASLQTLLDEPDFTTAGFLLPVLGEGTFLDLLRLLHKHAPDPVTADVTRLALRDEARHAAPLDTAGLNQEVFDAVVLLAAGSWEPAAIGRGWDAVQRLQRGDGRGPPPAACLPRLPG